MKRRLLHSAFYAILLVVMFSSCGAASCIGGHDIVIDVAVAPSCTQDGMTAGSHCATCGKVITAQQVIAALDHITVIDVATAPTCTNDGLTEGLHCENCGLVIKEQQIVHATGHTEVVKPYEEPTCIKYGWTEGKYCSICHEVLIEQVSIQPLGHVEVVDPAIERTCTTSGLSEGAHCSVCQSVIRKQVVLPAAHTDVIELSSVASSCTTTGLTAGSYCAACNQVIIEQKEVPMSAHIWIEDVAVEATCYCSGSTAGSHCAVCGYIEVEPILIEPLSHIFVENRCTQCHIAENFSDVSLYVGTWFYEYCTTLEKGLAYQELYRRIDEAVAVFHETSAEVLSVTKSGFGVAASVYYGDLNLDVDDLRLVRMFYQYDHPLYYWMSSTFNYANGNLNLYVNTVYIESSVRKETNQQLYSTLSEIAESVAGVTSTYELTMAYHDLIICMMDYAYQEDGKTAVQAADARWAYNIIGPFLMGSGVCKSYAEAFSLLLNYSGITNVITRGVADVSHRWNQVLMDDGQWYWFDLTWDDAPETAQGIEYHYFCVSDTQDVGWKDQTVGGKYTLQTGNTFWYKHTPDFDYGETNYVFDLEYPDCSDEIYANSGCLTWRETFTIDGLTYALIGYREVQVIRVTGEGTVVIPRSVIYNGVAYTVTSIGYMNETTKLMMQKTPITDRSCEIVVPETVKYIGINALTSNNVENVLLNANNEYFYICDGAIYEKLTNNKVANTTQANRDFK